MPLGVVIGALGCLYLITILQREKQNGLRLALSIPVQAFTSNSHAAAEVPDMPIFWMYLADKRKAPDWISKTTVRHLLCHLVAARTVAKQLTS